MELIMNKLNYKEILDGDKLPVFRKITNENFVFKLPFGGQYCIYKKRLWSDMWYINSNTRHMIGYGLTLKKAILVVLKDYFRTYYNTYFVSDTNNLILAIQYGQIINDCISKEKSIYETTTHTQRGMINAFRKLNDEFESSKTHILKKINHQIQLAIHCNQTEEKEDYINGDLYEED
jgi:hypothetical protein